MLNKAFYINSFYQNNISHVKKKKKGLLCISEREVSSTERQVTSLLSLIGCGNRCNSSVMKSIPHREEYPLPMAKSVQIS